MSRPVVHPKVLARLQEHFLPDTIDILSPSRVSDGQGGWTRTYATSSTVQGRIYPWEPGKTGDEVLSADKPTMIVSHRAIVPLATDVTGEDRVSSGGKTYRVVWVAERDQHKEVVLLEIE